MYFLCENIAFVSVLGTYWQCVFYVTCTFLLSNSPLLYAILPINFKYLLIKYFTFADGVTTPPKSTSKCTAILLFLKNENNTNVSIMINLQKGHLGC